MEVTAEEHHIEALVESIANAKPSSSSTARIHRVPPSLKEVEDYESYYVPKVVSIGPYHFGNKKLEFVENLKPIFTMRLVEDDKETLKSLYKKLGEPKMVQDLRNFYEENSTVEFTDNEEFTKIMLLDGCFILYYILNIFGEKFESCRELKRQQIVFIHEDLFLMENQIPYKVLDEIMNVVKIDCRMKIKFFIDDNFLVYGRQKKKCFESILRVRNDQSCREESILDINNVDHLLHLRHNSLTKLVKAPKSDFSVNQTYSRSTSHNVNELMDAGIHFKPSGTMSLTHIEFVRDWCWCRATIKLPPIAVDDSTKPMLLNLIAYEMCSPKPNEYSWVTSYVCLLDSLIDHPEDATTLRKAGALHTSIGSDKEVARLFNEIGTDLVPNNSAHAKARSHIQRHYDSFRNVNTRFSQLKHDYVNSPWAFLAVVGGVLVLFLTAVQTYFTVWSPKGECDDLCKFLKMNHHL